LTFCPVRFEISILKVDTFVFQELASNFISRSKQQT